MPSTQRDATTKASNGLIRVINSLDVVFLKGLISRDLFLGAFFLKGGLSKEPWQWKTQHADTVDQSAH